MKSEALELCFRKIESALPKLIFSHFVLAIDQVMDEKLYDSLLTSITKIVDDKAYRGFTYNMSKNGSENEYTAVNEVIDLLDGWILTANKELHKLDTFTMWSWEVLPLRSL